MDGSGVLKYLSEGLELSLIDVASLMMIVSDNVATNMLIDYLSLSYINRVIKDIGCRNTRLLSRFLCVENEPFSIITPVEYGITWKKLYNNELFDKETTDKIIGIIKNGHYHEMIGDGIDKLYKDSDNPLVKYVATKSGKYMFTKGDGGIVSTQFGDYVCVIFIHSLKDHNYLNDDYMYSKGRDVSRLLFDYFMLLHGNVENVRRFLCQDY